jgi:cysteine desulfurase
MGVPRTFAQGSLRFSLGRKTNSEEIDRAFDALTETVVRLRSMSPLYADARRKAKSA